MINIKEKLTSGFFYNCPEEYCIKELYYIPSEDKYCVANYLYSKIIDVHNITITDEEFKSRLLMFPDNVIEYDNTSNAYKIIESNIQTNEDYIPDFIGMIRHLLFSVANANLCDRTCLHCEHVGQCESVSIHGETITENNKAKDCRLFLDVDSKHSNQTNKILRMYFINALSDITSFDAFLKYCANYNLSRDLLRSLDINYIVFVNRNGCRAHGHAQVYATKDKAYEYAESMMKSSLSESQRFGLSNTFDVKNEKNNIHICYKTHLGKQIIDIQIVEV